MSTIYSSCHKLNFNHKTELLCNIKHIPFVERLIYYNLLSELFGRVVLEFGVGMFSYSIFEQKLLFYYAVLSIDYVFHLKQLTTSKFYFDQSTYVAMFFILMTVHGFLLGIGWHNDPAKIATDTIPLIFSAINIVLAAHINAFKEFSFDRLVRVNMIFMAIMIVFGALAVKLGKPSVVSFGDALSTTISIAIMAVSVWGRKYLSILFVLFNSIAFALVVPSFNRTTLGVVGIAFLIILFRTIAISGFRVYVFFLLIGTATIASPMIIPQDSQLGRRIEEMLHVEDIHQGEGSIGEREEESARIDTKISRGGIIAVTIGFGHGAVYDMVFTNGFVPPNYSNAHFGWALFKLRYGYCGYLYLNVFLIFILVNIYRNALSNRPFNRVILIVGLASVGYIATYMVFNLIASGLQFMHRRSDHNV